MKRIHLMLLLALAALFALSAVALAADETTALSSIGRPRQVIDAGGQAASVSGVALRGSLGQPIVGTQSNGNVVLKQGFWHGGAGEQGQTIFLPLVMK